MTETETELRSQLPLIPPPGAQESDIEAFYAPVVGLLEGQQDWAQVDDRGWLTITLPRLPFEDQLGIRTRLVAPAGGFLWYVPPGRPLPPFDEDDTAFEIPPGAPPEGSGTIILQVWVRYTAEFASEGLLASQPAVKWIIFRNVDPQSLRQDLLDTSLDRAPWRDRADQLAEHLDAVLDGRERIFVPPGASLGAAGLTPGADPASTLSTSIAFANAEGRTLDPAIVLQAIFGQRKDLIGHPLLKAISPPEIDIQPRHFEILDRLEQFRTAPGDPPDEQAFNRFKAYKEAMTLELAGHGTRLFLVRQSLPHAPGLLPRLWFVGITEAARTQPTVHTLLYYRPALGQGGADPANGYMWDVMRRYFSQPENQRRLGPQAGRSNRGTYPASGLVPHLPTDLGLGHPPLAYRLVITEGGRVGTARFSLEFRDAQEHLWRSVPTAQNIQTSITRTSVDGALELAFSASSEAFVAGDFFTFGFFSHFPQLGALNEHRRRYGSPWPERPGRKIEGIWDLLTYCSLYRNLGASGLPILFLHPVPLPGPKWGLATTPSVLDAANAIFEMLRPHMHFAALRGKTIATGFSAGGGALAALLNQLGERRREIDAVALFDAEGEEKIRSILLNPAKWHAIDGSNFHVIRGRHQTFDLWPDPPGGASEEGLWNADNVRLWPTRGRREYLALPGETESAWLWQFKDGRPQRDHNYLHQWPMQGGELDDGEYKGFLHLVLENMNLEGD